MGGATGGVLLSLIGSMFSFAVAAGAFLFSTCAMWLAKHRITTPQHTADSPGGNWLEVLREFSALPKVVALLLVGADFVTIAGFTVALAPLVHEIFGNTMWLGILDALFAAGAIAISFLNPSSRTDIVSLRRTISYGYAIQIIGLLCICFGVLWDVAGAVGTCMGSVVLGSGMALSSSQQVSFLQSSVDTKAVGKTGALRQAVIGITTTAALPLVGILIEVSLIAAYLGIAAFLALCFLLNVVLLQRERRAVALG
ncbi:MAG: MFS transporter [Corynebacterium sp.]|nr:MFS transporter [Corynebacterium sp.]